MHREPWETEHLGFHRLTTKLQAKTTSSLFTDHLNVLSDTGTRYKSYEKSEVNGEKGLCDNALKSDFSSMLLSVIPVRLALPLHGRPPPSQRRPPGVTQRDPMAQKMCWGQIFKVHPDVTEAKDTLVLPC